MRAPAFWWRRPPGALARLLQPLGVLYGAVTLARMRRAGAKAGIPVICVGNFVAGGAGKTPTALALAALLKGMGETPFVLMRGYGGRLSGPLQVEAGGHAPADVGDEPLLMAAHVPTIVARDRPAGAALAQAQGASLVLMDDGLQNPSLHKDLRLAVVDGAVGIGNGLCLPAGPLRAAFAGQIEKVDAVVVIGAGTAGDEVARRAEAAGRPVLRARLALSPSLQARLEGTAVLAASGIGRPEKFAATLREAGARLVGERAYGDHHAYTAEDVTTLLAAAKAGNCLVAVTDKDLVKLGPLWPEGERGRLLGVPVALVFEEEAALGTLLRESLARARSGAA